MSTKRPAIIIGGICLTGKTSLVRQLQSGDFFPIDFVEGDDLHTQESIAKMRFGNPLDEQDRIEWREKICDAIHSRSEESVRVIACSALTRAFRDHLRKSGDVRFIFLVFGEDNATKRARKRLRDTWVQIHEEPEEEIHYFQPAIYPELIAGQFRDLEIPGADEGDCFVIDLDQHPIGEYGPEVDFAALAPEIVDWLGFE